MINTVAIQAIGFYQRYISPHKGFCCAYRVSTGYRSCSEYAKIIVRRLGVMALYSAMPRQFARCQLAFTSLKETKNKQPPAKKYKTKRRDSCDCSGGDCGNLCSGVDDCNFFSRHSEASGCDAPSGCDATPCDCSF